MMDLLLGLAAMALAALLAVVPFAGSADAPTEPTPCCTRCEPGCCEDCGDECEPGCCDACPAGCCSEPSAT